MIKSREQILKLISLGILSCLVFFGFKVHKTREQKSWESFRREQDKILEEEQIKERERELKDRELNARLALD